MKRKNDLELLNKHDKYNKYNKYDNLNFNGTGYSIFCKEYYQIIKKYYPSMDNDEINVLLDNVWNDFHVEQRNEYYQKCYEHDKKNKYNYNGCFVNEKQYDDLNFNGLGYSIFCEEYYQIIQKDYPSMDNDEINVFLYHVWNAFPFEQRNEYYQKC